MKTEDELNQILQESPIASDAFFSTFFDNRIDRAELIIKPVLDYLGITEYKITSCVTQKRKSHFHQHDNVLDAQIEMEPMYEVSIEVQLSNPEKLNPKRIRYELGSDDVSFLQEGMNYSDLPKKIFMIFSKKDLNNSKLPIITVKRTIQETGEIFDDGQTIVYLNLENITDDDNPINNLISDLFEIDYHKIKNPDLLRMVSEIKESKEEIMFAEKRLQNLVIKEAESMFKEERKELEKKLSEKDLEIQKIKEQYSEKDLEIQKIKEQYSELQNQLNDLKTQLLK